MSNAHSGATTDRIIALVLRAQREPLPNTSALARELGVCRRTAQRLVAAVERQMPVRRQDTHG